MKKFAIFLSIFLVVASVSAQRRGGGRNYGGSSVTSFAHNLSFEMEGGLGALLINNSMGSPTDMGFDVGGNVGYTYMFNASSGIHTGLNFSYVHSGYSTNAIFSNFDDDVILHDNAIDYEGPAEIQSLTSSVDEKYNTLMLSMPIQYAYRADWFWANIGARISFPLSINCNYTYGPSTNGIVYFERSGVSYAEAPVPYKEEMNVGAQTGTYTAERNASFPLFVDLSAEFGYWVEVDKVKHHSLYIGFFVEYALNSFSNSNKMQFLTYIADAAAAQAAANTVTTSDGETAQFNGVLNSSVIDGYKSMTTGIKVYYNIGMGDRR